MRSAPLEKNQQLQVAAEAISQIVEVYVKRANSLLDSLEVTDKNTGHILDDNFLSGLMRQSMSLDLSDMMELLPANNIQVSPVSIGSLLEVIDRKAARLIARQERAKMKKALQALAEIENIPKWTSVIAHWSSQHQGENISLLQLQQVLGIPLVEVWLGFLHSPQYQWEQQGKFYREARDIWLDS